MRYGSKFKARKLESPTTSRIENDFKMLGHILLEISSIPSHDIPSHDIPSHDIIQNLKVFILQ